MGISKQVLFFYLLHNYFTIQILVFPARFPGSPGKSNIISCINKLAFHLFIFQQAAFSPSLQQADLVSSPQKCSNQGTTVSSIHQKTSIEEPALLSSQQKVSSSSMSVPQSPLKHQALSKGPKVSSSSQKPELCAKPSSSDLPVSKEKVTTGAFGESDWKAGYLLSGGLCMF